MNQPMVDAHRPRTFANAREFPRAAVAENEGARCLWKISQQCGKKRRALVPGDAAGEQKHGRIRAEAGFRVERVEPCVARAIAEGKGHGIDPAVNDGQSLRIQARIVLEPVALRGLGNGDHAVPPRHDGRVPGNGIQAVQRRDEGRARWHSLQGLPCHPGR